jgi:hypothetical protein
VDKTDVATVLSDDAVQDGIPADVRVGNRIGRKERIVLRMQQ